MYLDSAYLAKFYLNEPDSPQVRRLIESADTRVSSEWSVNEVMCAFHRHYREGALTKQQYGALARAFHHHIDQQVWELVPLNGRLIRRLTAALQSLPATIYLRAGDGIQLISAQEAGEPEIWSSDRHLLNAAPQFGLVGRSLA